MKTIIFSLGFDISGVVSALTTMSLEPGDKLIFVIPSRDTERAQRARRELEGFLKLLAARGLNLSHEYLRVNEENVQEALSSIMSAILSGKGEIYLEATGGLRSIVVALTLAAVVLRDRIASFHTVAESSGKRVPVPIISPALLNLDPVDKEILKLAASAKGEVTAPYLEVELEISKPTATRRLRNLSKKGLLTQIAKKPAKYRLTPIGWLAAQTAQNEEDQNADTNNKS